MKNWGEVLSRLVEARETELFPLLVYKVEPAAGAPWPAVLPTSPELLEFYSLCDGGLISDYHWASVGDLVALNSQWHTGLESYYADGSSPLEPGRHLVLATDSGGAPLIWDSKSGSVATFWFKGGDWEPVAETLAAFLEALFTADPESDEMWAEAISQLDG